jgi:hypothetical protein
MTADLWLTLAFNVAYFAVCDRYCGGGVFWSPKAPGRPIYYVWAVAVIFCIIFSFYPQASPYFSVQHFFPIALLWCAWRWPAWKLFGGSLAPVGRRQILGTAARHSLIFVCLLAVPFSAFYPAVFLLLFFVALATVLSAYVAPFAKHGIDLVPFVEYVRGAYFGAIVFTILAILTA